jgi:DNA-binding MarR family transcriptional regulator
MYIKTRTLDERDARILRYLNEHPNPSLRDLVSEIDVKSTGHVSTLIDRLVEDGYIEKRPGEARAIYITVKGLEFIGQAPNAICPTCGSRVNRSNIMPKPSSGR